MSGKSSATPREPIREASFLSTDDALRASQRCTSERVASLPLMIALMLDEEVMCRFVLRELGGGAGGHREQDRSVGGIVGGQMLRA